MACCCMYHFFSLSEDPIYLFFFCYVNYFLWLYSVITFLVSEDSVQLLKCSVSCWETETLGNRRVTIFEVPAQLQNSRDLCCDLLHNFVAWASVIFFPLCSLTHRVLDKVCGERTEKKWEHRPAIEGVLGLQLNAYSSLRNILSKADVLRPRSAQNPVYVPSFPVPLPQKVTEGMSLVYGTRRVLCLTMIGIYHLFNLLPHLNNLPILPWRNSSIRL